jgi:hypothetical protein
MTYDFSFDKKSIGAFLVCSAVLCVLLFFAGVLVGTGWNARADAHTAAQAVTQTDAKADAARSVAAQPVAAQPAAVVPVVPNASSAVLPQEPVLYDDPARREYASRGYGTQRYDTQGYDTRDYGSQAQAPQTYGANGNAASGYGANGYGARAYAPPSANAQATSAPNATNGDDAQAFNGRREAERLRARGTDPDPRFVAEADSADAGSNGARAAVAQGYSVQVGAYLDETEARRIASQLENKGYTPTVFSGTDAEARVWFAVRIGAYTSVRDASQAANNFARQEKMKASVRPAGSL